MKLLLATCILLQVCVGALVDPDAKAFVEFRQKYNKQYHSEQETRHRFEIFKANVARATRYAQQNPQASFGVTKFMDLSVDEFKTLHTNVDLPSFHGGLSQGHAELEPSPRAAPPNPNPTNWDWSQAGAVTSVDNEQECGAPWAFAPVETVESYWALAGHTLVKLSAQQVVDCDTNGVYGCSGGYPQNAYQYIVQNGLESAAEYPYSGEQGTCQYDPSKVVARIKGFVGNVTGGEPALYKQLSSPKGGPISVCVDASSWQMYTGGILSTCTNNIDHCAVITGYFNYGKANAYWNVRNDWGTDWGVNGYIWIAIGHNLCGIADWAQYPIV